MRDAKHIILDHEQNPEDYAAYWAARHVAELEPNPHAQFYNPLREERRWVDLSTVQSCLFFLAVLIAAINILGMVAS